MCPKGHIPNTWELLEGAKPLAETMLTKIHDAIWRH